MGFCKLIIKERLFDKLFGKYLLNILRKINLDIYIFGWIKRISVK